MTKKQPVCKNVWYLPQKVLFQNNRWKKIEWKMTYKGSSVQTEAALVVPYCRMVRSKQTTNTHVWFSLVEDLRLLECCPSQRLSWFCQQQYRRRLSTDWRWSGRHLLLWPAWLCKQQCFQQLLTWTVSQQAVTVQCWFARPSLKRLWWLRHLHMNYIRKWPSYRRSRGKLIAIVHA